MRATAQHPEGTTPETTRVEPLVTVEEAAAFLGVQVGTIYLWAECERIPSYKIGNLRRFRLSELEAHLHALQEGPERLEGRTRSVVGGIIPSTEVKDAWPSSRS